MNDSLGSVATLVNYRKDRTVLAGKYYSHWPR